MDQAPQLQGHVPPVLDEHGAGGAQVGGGPRTRVEEGVHHQRQRRRRQRSSGGGGCRGIECGIDCGPLTGQQVPAEARHR